MLLIVIVMCQHASVSNFTSDGEAAYTSEKEGVWYYYHHDDGLGDPTILTIHDPPHAADLLKSDGQSQYVVDCHRTIKAVFAHFSTSPKRTRQMVRMFKKYEAVFLNLHYLFEVWQSTSPGCR